jgi:hypothetical protein
MKRIKDLTNKERWLVSYLLWDATQKVERIMLYDDKNERGGDAMIALSSSPDEIDNLLCDIYYGVNTLSLKLHNLEEKERRNNK